MKKPSAKHDEMRADLGPLVRGKYAGRYAKSTNVVVIDPALTKAFPNNEALRGLLAVATASAGKAIRSSRAARKHVAVFLKSDALKF